MEFGLNFLVGFLIIQSLAMLGGFALAALPEHRGGDRGVLHLQVGAAAGLFALGSALMGWFADLSPWIDFQAAQVPVMDLSVNGDEWGHLIVSGLLWLGCRWRSASGACCGPRSSSPAGVPILERVRPSRGGSGRSRRALGSRA